MTREQNRYMTPEVEEYLPSLTESLPPIEFLQMTIEGTIVNPASRSNVLLPLVVSVLNSLRMRSYTN